MMHAFLALGLLDGRGEIYYQQRKRRFWNKVEDANWRKQWQKRLLDNGSALENDAGSLNMPMNIR